MRGDWLGAGRCAHLCLMIQMLADTEFIALYRTRLDGEISNRKDNLSKAPMVGGTEDIALRVVRISSEIRGLERARDIVAEIMGEHSKSEAA